MYSKLLTTVVIWLTIR
jgi:hypothetical protein